MGKKRVGNACRGKGQIRASKSKGKDFERNCEASLQQIWSDVHLTHELGYIQQYDIQSNLAFAVWECKRLKGICWNELVKFFNKLRSVAPKNQEGKHYACYILFKSNQQPCLVFDGDKIEEFERYFGMPFIKHQPVKRTTLKSDSSNHGEHP